MVHIFTNGFSGSESFRGFRETGPWRAFFESPETFQADFGHDNSHCILKTKTFLSMKLYYTFNISYLKDMLIKKALENEWSIFLQMAFRVRKVFGVFEKRAPGVRFSKAPKLFRTISGTITHTVS